jgi:putative phosphonate catabolism associated alcohol dehydrogenase
VTTVAPDVRYALWHGVGAPVTVESLDVPVSLPGGGVLVEIEAATVCGSDLHTALGHRPGPSPSVLGHEQVGRVVQVDETAPPTTVAGAPVRVGDRVVWSVAASCGSCDRCSSGLPQKCRTLRKYGHEAVTPEWTLNGGFGTHCVLLPGTAIVVVPDDMPAAVAAPAACATATVAAALEAADRPLEGARVLVTGAGMLGITAVAMASAVGASVVVSDPDAGRRARALCFGAVSAVAPDEPVDPVDVAIELSGHAAAVELAVDALDLGGVAVLVGAVSTSRPVTIDPERIVRGLHRIVGVHNYAPHHLAQAVAFLATTPLPFAALVEAPVGLEGVGDAVTAAPTSGYLRRSIVPSPA